MEGKYPSSLSVYLDMIQYPEKQLLVILQNITLRFHFSLGFSYFIHDTSDN